MKKVFTNTLLIGLSLFFTLTNRLNAQSWNQIAKVVASDRATVHRFGQAVAVNGDYAVIGASGANAAYIFKRTGMTWTQEAKIVASDAAAGDNFGFSVAISGDYVVVGAYAEDEDASGMNTLATAGSAYIFKRTGTTWAQEAKIVATDRNVNDQFGYSVGISGDYVIVAAPFEDDDATGMNPLTSAGSSYIFKRTGTAWAQEAKLVASDRTASNIFGASVAISGESALIGAISGGGAAYVFKWTGTTWAQEAKLIASDRASGDNMGGDVALSGDYAVMGAIGDDKDASGAGMVDGAGSAYVFKRTGTTWAQEAKIVASDRAAFDSFGDAVAIDGDLIVVGATNDDKDASGAGMINTAGSAYIFKRTGTTWAQEAKIVASVRKEIYSFGYAVGISNGYALVGAQGESLDPVTASSANFTGAAYFFSNSGITPVELLSFKGKNTEGGNLLTWATATEINSRDFDIERSNDGQHFTKIGTVKTKGSNATYEFTDLTPPLGAGGLAFYRLKINDLDGKTDYSKTISIQSKGKSIFKIYPSVTTGILTIETVETADIQVFNLLGQQVLNGQKPPLGVGERLDVSALPQGTYILRVGTEQAKFVKQ